MKNHSGPRLAVAIVMGARVSCNGKPLCAGEDVSGSRKHSGLWLVIRGVSTSLGSYEIRAGSQKIGRSSANDVQLTDRSVSRAHAELYRDRESFLIRDLDSQNGTFVNGVRISACPLALGDALRLGKVHLDVVATLARSVGLDSADTGKSGSSSAGADLPEERGAEKLSRAEQRVFWLLLQGWSEKRIAMTLKLSPNTVHCHVRRIYKAFEVQSKAALLSKYLLWPGRNGKSQQ